MGADPYSAVLGAAMGAAQAPPAGPSEAKSSGTIGGNNFDSSGWNVTFGANSAVSASRSQTTAGQFDQYMPYVVVGGALILAVLWLKKKH